MTDETLAPDERVAIARLHALLELLPTALDRELASIGLTSFEYTLLEALSEAEHHRLRLSALASRTNATLPRLSRVVTALERKGLVVRAPCAEDGRATNALLTDAGLAAHRAARPRYAEAVRSLVLSGLDESGIHQLADLSYAILAKLDPDARLKITADGACAADGTAKSVATCAADGTTEPIACAADPQPEEAAN
ncbi:hypothetical protein GCM10009785_22420 [Brooklawnia cerclae]|uniref:DNA-binding MarR family transcriptional regulator n=1 Tax=Brooklawnia cerclae TaxID=349934 RepID=A0ABX0SFG1_9ACTN|nr:MarR family transcriptional regulator [Brooklawnia cerclae]NIH57124.1 DNA-binding MarR family transcriptional regulator [Brooklawnia cerclae]